MAKEVAFALAPLAVVLKRDVNELINIAGRLQIPLSKGNNGPQISASRLADLMREVATREYVNHLAKTKPSAVRPQPVAQPASPASRFGAPAPTPVDDDGIGSGSGLFDVEEIMREAHGEQSGAGFAAVSDVPVDLEDDTVFDRIVQDIHPEIGGAAPAGGDAAEGDVLGDIFRDQERAEETAPHAQPVAVDPVEELLLPSEVVSVGNMHQLFLDDELIDSAENVAREWHTLTKHPDNPVLRPNTPWEMGGASTLAGSVLYDPEEKLFKMWYEARSRYGPAAAYAVSRDGLEWDRPEIGHFLYQARPTNMVMAHPNHQELRHFIGATSHYSGAKTESGPGYRAAYVQRHPRAGDGIRFAHSSDGIRWTTDAENAVPGLGGPATLMYDERMGCYAIYARAYVDGRPAVQRVRSVDFHHWSNPETVLQLDERDPEGAEIGAMSVYNYHPYYLALIQVRRPMPDGRVELQWAYSEDGRNWRRPDRRACLSTGQLGDWDLHALSPACGKIIRIAGRQLRFYYGGRIHRRAEFADPDQAGAWGAIGLATLRTDGFASLNAAYEGGVVTTKPVLLNSDKIRINAFSPCGQVRVAVLDAFGHPLQGMLSHPFSGDKVEAGIHWADDYPLAPYVGRIVRLKFQLRNAKLYSFWTE